MSDLYDVAHVAEWDPYNWHDLGHASWVGYCMYYADPAQQKITAG